MKAGFDVAGVVACCVAVWLVERAASSVDALTVNLDFTHTNRLENIIAGRNEGNVILRLRHHMPMC
jgi:hypothetical protein